MYAPRLFVNRALRLCYRDLREDLRESLLFPSSVATLLLRARKDRVGVISRSTILLSHGLSCKLRAGEGKPTPLSTDRSNTVPKHSTASSSESPESRNCILEHLHQESTRHLLCHLAPDDVMHTNIQTFD